ncbi:MAG: hypothetical protein J7498_02795 [Sphingobium sp.]|nr:hypothetical protein [Sphingobium sp.]
MPKAKRKPATTKIVAAPLPVISDFKPKAAAIIADRSTIPGRAWSDMDRDRVSQFRLTGDSGLEQSPASRSSSLIDKVKRREDIRGMSFGFDSGSQNLGPPVDASARSAEVVAYKLSETSTCNGLMPGVDCNTIGGDDVSVRLALAFNF